MNDLLLSTYAWIKEDWKSNPFRFTIELLAWVISIGCSFTMAVTVPNPPLPSIYPLWIIGCSMYCWAAWTRQSFGMVANYLLLVAIDVTGYFRMVAQYG